jgi:hypothetical protein
MANTYTQNRTRVFQRGYPERFAQALGHNSKAVHRACAKHAEVTVPSLDDCEKDWEKNPKRNAQSKLVRVDCLPKTDCNLQANHCLGIKRRVP